MTLIRTENGVDTKPASATSVDHPLPLANDDAPPALTEAPSLEQTVRAWYDAGHSQRAIARELSLDRRKIKRMIDHAA